MKPTPRYRKNDLSEIAASTNMVFVWLAILVIAFAGSAMAQTTVNQPTTTTLWAGSLDFTQFGLTQFTLPSSGVILSGTASSTITGQPVRHLWIGDAINGLCRIDPEVDEVVPGTAGIGGHSLNVLTCIGDTQERGITPAQLAFDAATNTLYLGNISRVGGGILRLHYIPSGDNGQGSFNLINIESLIGTGTARDAFGGCPAVKDPKNGTLVPVIPDSVALGPDGNLYTGSIRDGAIIRIISPATFNPATDCPGNGPVTPGPNDKIQIPILSPDEATSTGHNFGLGWIGHTLVGGDNTAPWIKFNADQCFTSANGNNLCGNPLTGGAPLPTEILASLAGAPQGATITDAQYPTFPGTTAYFASIPNVTKVTNIVDASNLTVQTNYGGTFSFITGLIADATNNQVLYVAADPVQGGVNGAGQIWQVSAQPCPPGVALTPVNVTATASVSKQATVNWLEPVSNCQTITSYVVRTLLAGGTASGVPDFTVTATPPTVPPPTATITGLSNGTSYQFEVEACDLPSCSAFSALSNVASLTSPAAPTGVVATLAGVSVNVSWKTLADPSVTSYTVSAFDNAAPGVAAATVTVPIAVLHGSCPTCGFPVITGLLAGHTYTFTVHATNVFGNGPESTSSLPVTVPNSTDVSVLMNAPATISAGSILTYNIVVTNNGPLNAAQVTVSDTLPAAISSFTSTIGVCSPAAGNVLTCNLGVLNAGSSAMVSVSVTIPPAATGSLTNTATVAAFDSNGAALADPNPANNTASATVLIGAPCQISTTDIQTVGASNNGNPVHGGLVTFTWQIKNNQGAVSANCVTFTATTTAPAGASLAIQSASSTIGACSISSNAVTCDIGTIPGGQTATIGINATPSASAPANSYSMTGTAQLGPGSTDTNIANNSSKVLIGAQ